MQLFRTYILGWGRRCSGGMRGRGKFEVGELENVERPIKGSAKPWWLVSVSRPLESSCSPLWPRGTFRWQVENSNEQAEEAGSPKADLPAGREGSCGYRPALTRGCHAVGNFMRTNDSFHFTPRQRWCAASTTSNQFCKSHFVAENWFAAPVPFWKPNIPGLGRRLC